MVVMEVMFVNATIHRVIDAAPVLANWYINEILYTFWWVFITIFVIYYFATKIIIAYFGIYTYITTTLADIFAVIHLLFYIYDQNRHENTFGAGGMVPLFMIDYAGMMFVGMMSAYLHTYMQISERKNYPKLHTSASSSIQEAIRTLHSVKSNRRTAMMYLVVFICLIATVLPYQYKLAIMGGSTNMLSMLASMLANHTLAGFTMQIVYCYFVIIPYLFTYFAVYYTSPVRHIWTFIFICLYFTHISGATLLLLIFHHLRK